MIGPNFLLTYGKTGLVTSFGIEKMIASTQIATLDHNHNVNGEQLQTIYIFGPEFLLSGST